MYSKHTISTHLCHSEYWKKCSMPHHTDRHIYILNFSARLSLFTILFFPIQSNYDDLV